jgi:hypothetical protein
MTRHERKSRTATTSSTQETVSSDMPPTAGTPSTSQSGQTLSPLVQAKLPFILRDYTSYFESSTRIMTRISALRTWQVTSLGGLILLPKNLPLSATALLGGGLWLLFLTMECAERAAWSLYHSEAHECERLLQAKSLAEFEKNILAWEFTTQKWNRRTLRTRLTKMIGMLGFAPVILWHGMVLVLLETLILYGHDG